MDTMSNKELALLVLERGFNQGDLSTVDQYLAADGVDHQEPPGTDFRTHVKEVITNLHTGFPDLHFEVHNILADGDIVAFRSTMTGTHTGSLNTGRGPVIRPTGRKVAVPHMHFLRFVNGQNTDLWHIWDTPQMMQQLGVMPQSRPVPQSQ
ncbi:MAG: hypothetical protein GC179_16560 [Anaerolineaceae bacterium]|nr:hypothetical protein [Anaerolineaceae bacterium]